tara:strand:- start:23 stop:196 length:174 start_codon:yes stop_codon:yes gene_type:complete
MVRLGNFKRLEVIGDDGDVTTWEDGIDTVFLSISEDGESVTLLINPDESEFKEEVIK